MNNLEPSEVLKFLDLVINLKHFSRRGWQFAKVDDHESISGHMYMMGIMTFLLGKDSKLDRLKCLQLALVHDLAECIVGDITPHDNIPVEEKHAKEDEAMKEITSHVGSEAGTLIYNLYKEYEAKETPEAKFIKDLDCFDFLFTAAHYEKRDKTPLKLQQCFDACRDKINNPFIQKLLETVELQRKSQEDNSEK